MKGNGMGLVHRILIGLCLASLVQPLNGQERAFNPGLLWRTGLAPQPSIPLPAGNRAWYVDANAPNGGNGSAGSPYNSFEVVVGQNVGDSYQAGQIRGGDHLYLAGEFHCSNPTRMIEIARVSQGGSLAAPTLITTWPGKPRAVFNGDGTALAGIVIRRTLGIRVESLEIHDCLYYGIRVFDGVQSVVIANIEAHHTRGASGSGVSAGISVSVVGDYVCDYTIRNNAVYHNDNGQTDRNISGITILSEGSTLSGSIVRVYDNVIFEEYHGINHKHSGNVIMEAHHNLIHHCDEAFYIRAYRDNQIHHNLIVDCAFAFTGSRENIQGSQYSTLSHNTVVNSGMALALIEPISTLPPGQPFHDHYTFRDNLVYAPTQSLVLALARWSSTTFNPADWSSSQNLFTHAGGPDFLHTQGVNYAFPSAMSYLGDTTSRTIADPRFCNLATGDYRLAADSPARGAGENGSDVGALAYGSRYILDLNRYTVMPTGTLTITSPNGGEAWQRGESRTITWASIDITGNVVIELVQNGAAVGVIAENVAATAGTFAWTVGRLANGTVISGTGCKIRIRAASSAASQLNMTF